MRGLIHIYCGDGKGKSTAALGLALRAVGRGKRVVIARFLKNDDSGEIGPLSRLGGVTLIPCRRSFGFTWNMTPEERAEAAAYYGGLLEEAWRLACPKKACGKESLEAAGQMAISGADTDHPAASRRGADLLILDEALGACSQGMISEKRLLELLDERPEELEVVLTGRNPSEALLARGDYVTRMEAVRHPYERGIGAREGIEY